MVGLTRNAVLLLPLFGICSIGFAATPVSVEQLEQLLTAASGEHDAQLARKLSGLDLTQRLNSSRLSHWQTAMPGPKAQHALLALANKSAFLDLPPAEIPATPAPGPAAQHRMLSLSLDYISKTIRQLPNLFATRVTTSYQETLWLHWVPESGLIRYEPLHLVGQYSADVVYRDGGGQAHAEEPKKRRRPPGLETSGEFSLLGTVLEDAVQGKLSWSHWEQSSNGLLAVYQYVVPAEKSHYQVGSSWLQNANGERIVFQQFSGYRGEIAIDPASGTIFRLILTAQAKPTDLLVEARILVEYGPFVLDGRTYVCPVHSVALSAASGKQTYSAVGQPAPRFLQTSLNDVVFARYHLFHADARILDSSR